MISFVPETGSTNKDLLNAAADGREEGAVLVTDHQTAGRGRQGRVWIDEPESSLLCSVLLRPASAWAPLIPLITGVALVKAVRGVAGLSDGVSVGLKWPNDVLIVANAGERKDERKMAGILAEATTLVGLPPTGGLAVVSGFGVNLRFSAPPGPELAQKAVDLASVSRRSVDRLQLLHAVLVELESLLSQLEDGKSDMVLETYRGECLTIGRQLRFQTGSIDKPVEVQGRAIDVDSGGGLILEKSDGERLILTAGDAHHVG